MVFIISFFRFLNMEQKWAESKKTAITADSLEGSGTGALPVTPNSTVDGSAGRQTRRFTRSHRI